MMKHVYFSGLSVLLACGFLNCSIASAAATNLIAGPAATPDASAARQPRTAARSRLVRLNTAALFAGGAPRGADTMPEVSFHLFDDAMFTGLVKSVAQEDGTTTWQGVLKDVANGYFYIVAVDDAVIVHVASPRGVYEVANAGGGLYRVIEIDPHKNGEDFPRKLPAGKAPDRKSQSDTASDASGSQIDVVVFYTDAARAAEGSTAAMRARIALAVSETNGAYANSGISTRLRLVHTEEAPYVESGNIGTDLTRFATAGDGYLDQVQGVRDAFGADMASLITENGGGYCGLANAIMASPDNAYDVTARDCATGYYSFGHEFGHLQGARHDMYVDSTTTPFAYGHGYTHSAVDALDSWRTVMAYNNACSDFGYNCTRLQYFSNPANSYRAAAMGSSGTSENFRVLNETAATVAAFRPVVIGKPFRSSFNGSAAGWKNITGQWSVTPRYYTTSGVAGRFSSTAHTGLYGDVAYSAKLRRTGCENCTNGLLIRGKPGKLDSVKDWLPSYQFAYTNNGYYSVFRVEASGSANPLVDWTESAAIVKGGWNTLSILAVGNNFRFSINGTPVWEGIDASLPLAPGRVGINMYRTTASTGDKLYVDQAVLTNAPASGDVPEASALPAPPVTLAEGNPSVSP